MAFKVVESDNLKEILEADPIPMLPQVSTNELAMSMQKEYVRHYFKENPDGEFLPLWGILTGNNYLVPTITPWKSTEEKHAYVTHIRGVMAKLSAKRFIFTSESWLVAINPEENKTFDALKSGALKVSDMENREEVVSIVVGDKENTITAHFRIHRNWETNEVESLEEMGGNMAQTDGLLANML